MAHMRTSLAGRSPWPVLVEDALAVRACASISVETALSCRLFTVLISTWLALCVRR